MQFNSLLTEFNESLKTKFLPPPEFSVQVASVLKKVRGARPISKAQRKATLFGHINRKFRLNHDTIQAFLAFAAGHGITFNYHEKKCIADSFDLCDESKLRELLGRKGKLGLNGELSKSLLTKFVALDHSATRKCLHAELRQPTLTRKDSKPRDWSAEILTSLFAAFVYSSFPQQSMHMAFDLLQEGQEYEEDFWLHLHKNFPQLFSRRETLAILKIASSSWPSSESYTKLKLRTLRFVQAVHSRIANHGYLAIIIDPLERDGETYQWQLFADITLYAEKHLANRFAQPFFRASEIQRSTAAHISALDLSKADFQQLNHGFFYQDCFVFGGDRRQRMLLLFQKHQADETLIPCPACRSHLVQSNSYSSFGVRSWECGNQLCPDRSKFNRGKRYSFLQLMKQRAIEDPANIVPVESVRQWSRDVQPHRTDEEIVQMLVRHYSLSGDSIYLYEMASLGQNMYGRTLVNASFNSCSPTEEMNSSIEPERFFKSAYFQRYLVERSVKPQKSSTECKRLNGTTAYRGDSFNVLAELPAESVDGAVTSPPYYNAREYSQWENIYCYLYDMYNINKQVFRVLKPGAFYLFNIFDYFDNERNISLSAMGEKRMILGAYIVNMFVRMGFRCVGNVVWDKGEIEGKRGFNNGNFSPYYQAPFNCWEHIFVFAKPGAASVSIDALPTLLQQKPVIKMVRGENLHGHTAPFPEAIPRLLSNLLPKGATVLDPFGGSMTTAQVAAECDQKAICIELSQEYFELGLRKLSESARQQRLL